MPRETPAERLQAAWVAHRDGRGEEAERAYRALLAEFPGNAATLNRLGILLAERGRHGDALEVFEQAMAAAPIDPSPRVNAARSALALGLPERAEAAATAAIGLGAGATAFQLAAGAQRDLDRLATAQATLEAGLQRFPADFGLRFNLAACHALAGDSATAERGYRALLEGAPGRPRVLHGLANALAAQGRHAEAEARYRDALDVAPDSTHVLLDLGVLLLQRDRSQEALDTLERALTLAPGDPAVIAPLGVAAWRTGNAGGIARLLDWSRLLLPMDGPALSPPDRDALVDALVRHPSLQDAPPLKTTRGGGQTGRLGSEEAGPVGAFVRALEARVASALEPFAAALAAVDHPLAATRPAGWRLHVWATLLRVGGHQAAHLHPAGWASGVYYLAVPDIGEGAFDGWIEFGAPPDALARDDGMPTRRIRPEAGRMLLFPSSSYHRTLPHRGEGLRISIAFDVVPERGPG